MVSVSDPRLFEFIAHNHRLHARDNPWWLSVNSELCVSRLNLLAEMESTGGVIVGPVGFVPFSYVEMGAITSLDLFGLDELILLSFYWANRDRYSFAVDMGANVGLHSVLLARMGLMVKSYEPDPVHVALLRQHLGANGLDEKVTVVPAAVARFGGEVEFVRVLGNTTGSHVAGAKQSPYGKLEVFAVEAIAVEEAIPGSDLVKMDVEGLEADLLTALTGDDFAARDIVCEVGTPENAATIWKHYRNSGVKLFSQKTGWRRVADVHEMPFSYKEGSLFLSRLEEMPWGTT